MDCGDNGKVSSTFVNTRRNSPGLSPNIVNIPSSMSIAESSRVNSSLNQKSNNVPTSYSDDSSSEGGEDSSESSSED